MPKSQAEARHEAFVEAGEHAKTRADDALVDIDKILAEQDALIAGVGWMASRGWLDAEAAEEQIRAFQELQ